MCMKIYDKQSLLAVPAGFAFIVWQMSYLVRNMGQFNHWFLLLCVWVTGQSGYEALTESGYQDLQRRKFREKCLREMV